MLSRVDLGSIRGELFTVRRARYERKSTPGSFTPFGAWVPAALRECPADASDGDRRPGRLERDDHLVTEQRPPAATRHREVDPGDRLMWDPGVVFQCDPCFRRGRLRSETARRKCFRCR